MSFEAVRFGFTLEVDGCEKFESCVESECKSHKSSLKPWSLCEPSGVDPDVDLDEVLTDEGEVVVGFHDIGEGSGSG
jgi:hypothetical protein